MKFRFTLINLETGDVRHFGTLREISKLLNIEYHKIRSLYVCEEKIYLHPYLKELSKKYKIKKIEYE